MSARIFGIFTVFTIVLLAVGLGCWLLRLLGAVLVDALSGRGTHLILLHLLEGVRVGLDLSLDRVDVLLRLTVLHPDNREDFADLPERVNLTDVFPLTRQERLGELLDLGLLSLVVGCIVDPATVRQSVMHGELLLQVSDLLLEALDLQGRVHHGVHGCLVRDLHHARGELQRRSCLGQVARLWPNVSDHDGLAVTADRVAKEVGQFRLAVGNVAAFLARESEHDLLEERKRLVDEAGLLEDEALRACLLGHLTAGEVDEVQFGEDDFVG